jgi:radical SAM superfamily enzyme YgiQ (UPF0313 family)
MQANFKVEYVGDGGLMNQNGISSENAKIKIGLVQINNSFSGQNYLPYSVGLLQSYIQTHAEKPERYEFLLPIYSRRSVQDMVTHLLGADVIGFSTYVWNVRVSLEVARQIKARQPDTLIVFGGPQVPDQAEAFLKEHPFIDLACHGEGEQVFLSVLDHFPERNWDDVPSVSYVKEDGTFECKARVPRLKDLADIPSPYLENTFKPLMDANPDEVWLILWETNRGCPFSCTFCDWGSAVASKVYRFDDERIFKEIEWFAEQKIEFVFCCDANFGILPRDLEIAQKVAEIKGKHGYPHALSVQNTKNAKDRAYQVQKTLSDAGLNKGVTISLQSVDPNTLKSIKRQNISSDAFQELQRKFTRDKVETYSDMILGLPGETYDSFGISDVIKNGQHNRIQFNNLSILPNSEMGNPEYQKKYGMISVESRIFNIHGSVEELNEEIPEVQELVIGTDAMPPEDWVKTRAFCWMAGLLHFDKVLQIPLILVNETCSVSYRELIEAFMDVQPETYPTLFDIRSFLEEKARDIQSGGSEYCHSKEWLSIGWPADEYILIQLCNEEKLDNFYAEAEARLLQLLKDKFVDLPKELLHEAVDFNKSLVKLPFQLEDIDFQASYNLWEFYRSILVGEAIPLETEDSIYHIDRTTITWSTWEEWCREVIWYGNKKGAYLYGNDFVTRQLAGHY